MAASDSNAATPRATRRFPDAGRDPLNKQFAQAAQAVADKAGLRSRYLSGEAAEFRQLFRATKERGVITIERRDSGKTAKLKAADLRALALEGNGPQEAAAALREVAAPPKLSGRKLAVYLHVATDDKRIGEVL